MEQGTLTAPNIASLDRLTGKAIFFPAGQAGGIDLGDIDMMKLDYAPKRETVDFHINGNVVLGVEETISVSPVFSIDGKQFHSAIMPLVLMGTRNSDVSQTSATGATLTIVAKLGQAFDIGARNVTNMVVTNAGATITYIADVDYFFDPYTGIIRFPSAAAGIADGASVLLTFNKPAIVRDSYTAFTNENLQGTLKVFGMDNRSGIPKSEWTLPGNFTVDKGGDNDPAKHKQWSVRFAVIGQPTVLRRQS